MQAAQVLANINAERQDSADRERDMVRRLSSDVQEAAEQTDDANVTKICEVFTSLRKNAHIDTYRSAMCCIADAISELRAEEERDRERDREDDGDTDARQDARRDNERDFA
jgi:16S rRNA U1498 N3-methylase RsmE